MKRHTVTSQPGAAQTGPGGTARGDLSPEFEGMARLARGIAQTRCASISITGVGETLVRIRTTAAARCAAARNGRCATARMRPSARSPSMTPLRCT